MGNPTTIQKMRAFLGLALALALAALAPGCDAGAPAGPRAADTPLFDTRQSNTTCLAPAKGEGKVRFEPLFGGGQFATPVDAVLRGNRIWVVEYDGHVRLMDRTTGQVTTALDASGTIGPEARFVAAALHPTKPLLFVAVDHWFAPYWSEVVTFETKDGGATFDPASRQVVIHVDRPTEYHGVGALVFDRKGLLYIAHGDGGTNNGPELTRYDPSLMLGAILRIDVDSAKPYAIPPDNPRVGRAEVWAGGFRNPFRFSFDRESGALWAGDVGGERYEEIDVVEPGKDYGWPVLEGFTCMKPREGCDPTGKTPPKFAYPHTQIGGSITGGFVYRGKLLPELVGKYVYADFILGHLWVLHPENDVSPAEAERLNGVGVRSSTVALAEDDDGELYAVDFAGSVYALRPGKPQPFAIPDKLSKTGCVDPNDPRKPAPGLVPYDVNMELWSDGAAKERWFAIPDGKRISVYDSGEWNLPDGSVLMKSFTVGGKRIETRLLMHLAGHDWTAYAYRWNEDETEATRVDAPTELPRPDGAGTWHIPGPDQCFACHTVSASVALGVELAQTDRPRRTSPENQIAAWTRMGLLDTSNATARRPTLPTMASAPDDATRARAYLHTNCSICHRPGGTTPSEMDLRFERPFADLRGCTPASAVEGASVTTLLAPGDPARSAIYARASRRGRGQMPPLGTVMVDDGALKALSSWITGLPACQ